MSAGWRSPPLIQRRDAGKHAAIFAVAAGGLGAKGIPLRTDTDLFVFLLDLI
jgi:hypothetical protein